MIPEMIFDKKRDAENLLQFLSELVIDEGGVHVQTILKPVAEGKSNSEWAEVRWWSKLKLSWSVSARLVICIPQRPNIICQCLDNGTHVGKCICCEKP